MVKVYWDAGHGGSDPGALGNGLKEANVVLKIAKYANDYLLATYENVQTKLSRTTNKFKSLKERTDEANKWGADAYVSIHNNAFNGVANGFESFVYPNTNSTTKNLQSNVHAEVMKVLAKHKTKDRGKKQANFHVLRESNMPAVLTENLFIDAKEGALLKNNSFLKELGVAHAVGVAKYFKLKKKVVKPKPTPKPNKLYKVQTGAFKNRTNAVNLQKQLSKKGFKDSFIKLEGGLYKVQLGAFGVKANAVNLEKKLKKAGFDTFIKYE